MDITLSHAQLKETQDTVGLISPLFIQCVTCMSLNTDGSVGSQVVCTSFVMQKAGENKEGRVLGHGGHHLFNTKGNLALFLLREFPYCLRAPSFTP